MTSKSRLAHNALDQLEKLSAPFAEQLTEAAKFIGVEFKDYGRLAERCDEAIKLSNLVPYKREEWLMIWLSKKLKADHNARKMPSSWSLLRYLIQSLPLRSATRILLSKEVITEEKDNPSSRIKRSILQETLIEAHSTAHSLLSSAPNDQHSHNYKFKKRKLNGQTTTADMTMDNLPNLIDGIYNLLNFVIKAANLITKGSVDDSGASLSAAYMKTAYITSSEKAAELLGLWIALCEKTLSFSYLEALSSDSDNWLIPFVELWNSRIKSDTEFLSFSIHCTPRILSLINTLRKYEQKITWQPELERLLARNTLAPAKQAFLENPDSNLLETFMKPLAPYDLNAPVLFEISIRSIMVLETGRRRQEDEAWLLKTFKDLLNIQGDSINNKCKSAMLQLSIDYKVDLNLELLRSITLHSILSECKEEWELIEILVRLNPDIFVISKENGLLEKLLEKITMASLASSWVDISDKVVSQILVPLVDKFAREKNLIRFIHFWYNELSRFDLERKRSENHALLRFSAWEDNKLHLEVQKLLVPSVDSFQIRDVITWVSEKVDEQPHACCILLEVISGSISRQEDLVDMISLQPYHILFDEKKYMKLQSRYRWRAWRVLTYTFNWANTKDLSNLGRLWRNGEDPYIWFLGHNDSLLVIDQESQLILPESLEIFRSICAAFNASTKESPLEYSIKPVLLRYLQLFFSDVLRFYADFHSKNNFNICIPQALFEFVRCVFVEYSKTLILGLELKGEFELMLKATFDLASESFASPFCTSHRLRLSADAYPALWFDAFESDEVLNSKELTEILLDVILYKFNSMEYQDERALMNCSFAIKILNRIPMEVVKKKQKEKIMRSWFLMHDKEIPGFKKCKLSHISLDPIFFALKKRIMERSPNLYEGLEFEKIICLADKLVENDISELNIKISLLKELAHLIVAHAHTNIDQISRRNYLNDALKAIQNRNDKTIKKKKHKFNAALISIVGAAFFEFQKKTTGLQEMSVISKEELDEKINNFKEQILINLNKIMRKYLKKYHSKEKISSYEDICIHVMIDTLISLGVSESHVAKLGHEAQTLSELSSEVGHCLNTFMSIYGPRKFGKETRFGLDGNISSIEKRKSVQQITEAIINEIDDAQKLKILQSLIKDYHNDRKRADKLLAARYIIISIKDTNSIKITIPDENRPGELKGSNDDVMHNGFDLNMVYILLNSELRETHDILSFCIISETLDLMLRTKVSAISQYVIDSTLGSISIICSPESPQLPATRSGTIFLHLTQLMRSVITHHRLKLKGHFPLVQLSMQGLLRCFFHSTSYSNTHPPQIAVPSFDTLPVWLMNPNFQLGPRNAESYTRLLTLINDPSVSSVQMRRSRVFVSATKKWKHMSMFFMRFVLYDYINWQLKFRIVPEVKEQLLPGFYSFLANTTVELRQLISSELNSSSRVLFVNLFTDYKKFKERGGL